MNTIRTAKKKLKKQMIEMGTYTPTRGITKKGPGKGIRYLARQAGINTIPGYLE